MEKQRAATARQWQSVQEQAKSVGVTMLPGTHINATGPAVPEPLVVGGAQSSAPCDALGDDAVTPLIEGAAKTQNLGVKLLRAVIEQESGFHPCAVSPKGAKGMMQLMPDTAHDLGVIDPFDAKENIEAGAKYLKQLLDKYKGDTKLALGAYNAGSATVDQAGGVPNIPETRDYVNSIMQKINTIRTDPPSIQMPKPIEN